MIDPDAGILARRKKLFVYADTFSLTREERIDIAEMVLRRDVNSWNSLIDDEVKKLLECFESYLLVRHLLDQRRA